jgi:hypothetical protein
MSCMLLNMPYSKTCAVLGCRAQASTCCNQYTATSSRTIVGLKSSACCCTGDAKRSGQTACVLTLRAAPACRHTAAVLRHAGLRFPGRLLRTIAEVAAEDYAAYRTNTSTCDCVHTCMFCSQLHVATFKSCTAHVLVDAVATTACRT